MPPGGKKLFLLKPEIIHTFAFITTNPHLPMN